MKLGKIENKEISPPVFPGHAVARREHELPCFFLFCFFRLSFRGRDLMTPVGVEQIRVSVSRVPSRHNWNAGPSLSWTGMEDQNSINCRQRQSMSWLSTNLFDLTASRYLGKLSILPPALVVGPRQKKNGQTEQSTSARDLPRSSDPPPWAT